MMDIRKLQKKLLKEELKRRRQKSTFWRLLVPGVLLGVILVFGSLIFYMVRLDDLLEEDYVQGEVLLNQGKYQGALDNFHAIYKRHKTFHLAPQALYQSGEIQDLYLKRYSEALLAYLSLQKEFPDEHELVRKAQARIADIYKNRQRDYSRALVEYGKLLELGADNPDRVQYEIADAYFRLEQYPQASVAFERLTTEYPQSPLLAEARYRLGTVYSLLGNNSMAITAFRDVATRWPESPYALEAQFSLVTVLEEKDELRQAFTLLQSLQGRYANAEALNQKLSQLKNRMSKQQRD